MLQSGGLMDEVTVAELVRLGCALHPRAYPAADVLARAGLTKIADRRVDKLSGGQAQRVRFALATAGDSDLIVLDEPTTGMDVTARQAFWATMREQADQGRTVLFATHYLEEADAIATGCSSCTGAGCWPTARPPRSRPGPEPAGSPSTWTRPGRKPGRKPGRSRNGTVDEATLRALPHLTALDVSGRTVRIQSADADATVYALYGLGLYPRNLEVAGLGLEQAFVALTAAEEAKQP